MVNLFIEKNMVIFFSIDCKDSTMTWVNNTIKIATNRIAIEIVCQVIIILEQPGITQERSKQNNFCHNIPGAIDSRIFEFKLPNFGGTTPKV